MRFTEREAEPLPFAEARDSITPAQRVALDGILGTWDASDSTARQAATNLRAEKGGPDAATAAYLEELVDGAVELQSDPARRATAFARAGRTFALAGYASASPDDLVLGRASRLEKFAGYLKSTFVKHYAALRCTDTEATVLATLQDLHAMPESHARWEHEVYFRAMRLMALGRFAVFATFFDLGDVAIGPWRPPLPRAPEVRSGLALGTDPAGSRYVLVAYRLPRGVRVSVPTTASPGWDYQLWFRPSASAATERHGWTAPLEPIHPRRREVVHPEAIASRMKFPIHMAYT